jgi:hypothetical protein
VDVVTSVVVQQPYVLEVTFADGACVTRDVEGALYGPVFEALRDPSVFAQASVDRELGTVVWPNGADLSPEYLRTGEPATEPRAEDSS